MYYNYISIPGNFNFIFEFSNIIIEDELLPSYKWRQLIRVEFNALFPMPGDRPDREI